MARQINEEAVYKQIDHMDEQDGSDYADLGTDDGGDDEADEEESAEQPDDDTGDDAAPEVEASTEGTDEEGEVPQPQPQNEFRKLGNNTADKHGNIVDPRTGTIIAKAGTERRLFEKSQRLNTMLDEHKTRLAKYEKDEQDTSTYFGSIKAAGLSTEEIGEAFNIAIQFKQNPVAAAKEVLERVLAMGHNVTDILGADPGNAIEMPAIARLIDQRLAPILQPLEQQRAQTERERVATENFNKWVSDNDYVDLHLDVLDNVMGRNPDLTPQKAWNALILFANKQGLDITQPLGPQIARQSVRGTDTNPRERRAQQQRPFPTGSSVQQQPLGESAYADSNASWSDIVRQSMNGGGRPQR